MATSAEPSRTSAYSPDIGWRVVWQRIDMGLSFEKLQHDYRLVWALVHRLYMKFEETGEVAPVKRGRHPDSWKLDGLHKLYVLGLLAETPSLCLKEICPNVHFATGI